MIPNSSHWSRRKTLVKILLYVVLCLLAVCFVSGTAEEVIQIGGEMFSQRFFPMTPQPVTFPTGLVRESAQQGEQADLDHLMADLSWLADDARQGRAAGSAGEDEVDAWLAQRLQTLGLRTFSEGGRRGSSALGRLLRAKGLTGSCLFLNLEMLGAAPGKGTYLDV